MSYIVPRDIPKNCFECPCCTLGYCRVDVKTTEYAKYVFSDGQDGRYPDCPLVEIPTPHGRLGDLDALQKQVENTIQDAHMSLLWKQGMMYAHGLVETSKTVIEAEGETDGR